MCHFLGVCLPGGLPSNPTGTLQPHMYLRNAALSYDEQMTMRYCISICQNPQAPR